MLRRRAAPVKRRPCGLGADIREANMKRTVGGLLICAALVAGSAAAEAKQTSTTNRTVGQWAIQTVLDDGKFTLCRASTKTPGGDVNVILYSNKRWAISVPDMAFPKGTKLTGMLEIGRASQPISTTAGDAGVRERFFLDPGTLEAMRAGGRMSVTLGGKTYSWQMSDAGQAMGAVEDCLNTALKGAVPTAAAAPAKSKQTSTPFRTVGQWKVETTFNDGKFYLCRAVTAAKPSGQVNVILYPNDKWAISVPDMAVPKGTKLSGMMEIGRASQPISTTAQEAGVRERFFLDPGTLDAMRAGGRMSVTLNGKGYSWDMNDAGQALGAVQDCLAAARKNGG